MSWLIFEDRTEGAAALIVAGTGFLLAGALIMEHIFMMEPCPLCLMQRVWFAIAGLLALAIALTTLPKKDGCRSPKKLTNRPSSRRDNSTRTSSGFAPRCGCTGVPVSSTA